jgi:hypothetical protein
MITVEDLTVGQVSGLIAAAVFVGTDSAVLLVISLLTIHAVQILVPIALPVILLGLLRPRSTVATETAVSWYEDVFRMSTIS